MTAASHSPHDKNTDAARWSGAPNWYLWEGGFCAIGRSEGIVPPHAHHAIQIVIAFEGTVGIRAEQDADWRIANGVVVQPDVEHSYNGNRAVGAMVFVEPESFEGVWLRSALREPITLVPASRLSSSAGELRRFVEQPLESLEIGALITHCVQALCAGAPPSRRLAARVTRVLTAIRLTSSDSPLMLMGNAKRVRFPR